MISNNDNLIYIESIWNRCCTLDLFDLNMPSAQLLFLSKSNIMKISSNLNNYADVPRNSLWIPTQFNILSSTNTMIQPDSSSEGTVIISCFHQSCENIENLVPFSHEVIKITLSINSALHYQYCN